MAGIVPPFLLLIPSIEYLPFVRALLSIWLIFAALCSHAGETNITPPQCIMEGDSAVIPLKMAGSLLIIEATVDGIDGNFILDTGAPYLVLNSTYFRDYISAEDRVVTGVGGQYDLAYRSRVKNLGLDQISYKGVDVDLTDLGALEEKRGIQIHGLFGLNLLTPYLVKLDVRNRVLVLYKKNQDRPKADIKIDMESTREAIFMDLKVSGVSSVFSIDTGAEVSVLNTDIPAELLSDISIRKRSLLTSSTGSEVEVLLGSFKRCEIQGKEFRGMPLIITNLEVMGESYRRSIDGMLGISLLVRGVTYFDFENQSFEMYLYD